MSTLNQPAFPGGQVQSMTTESGKPILLPNYSGFTKREMLHILSALVIYNNDRKIESLMKASVQMDKTLEDLMIETVNALVTTIETSISKGEENAREQEKANNN